METVEHPIIFYDGECGFCDRTVKWVMARDKDHQFRFAALQGATAERLIGAPVGDPSTWSIILLDANGQSDRSTAALKIAKQVHYAGFLPALCLWIPRPVRDLVYKVIAKIRYRIFGKVTMCPIPSPETRALFLP